MVFTPSPNMKSKISECITICELRELFEVRGSDVVWKSPRHPRIKIGQTAGWKSKGCSTTYRRVSLTLSTGDEQSVFAHHISFALANGRWPLDMVDHRDCNGLNNTPSNLREATRSQNMQNRRTNKNSKLGVKGVCYKPGRSKPYRVQISVCENARTFEDFTTLEDAQAAAQEARTKYHGDFARHA